MLDTFVNIISSKDRRRLASARKYVGTCPSVEQGRTSEADCGTETESKLSLAHPRPERSAVGALVHKRFMSKSTECLHCLLACDVGKSICGVYLLGHNHLVNYYRA